MKLKYEFEMVEIGDELSAVPVGDNADEFHAVVQLNDVGAKMLKYIAESQSPEEVLQKLITDYPNDDRDDIAQKLCGFLNQLILEGILIP